MCSFLLAVHDKSYISMELIKYWQLRTSSITICKRHFPRSFCGPSQRRSLHRMGAPSNKCVRQRGLFLVVKRPSRPDCRAAEAISWGRAWIGQKRERANRYNTTNYSFLPLVHQLSFSGSKLGFHNSFISRYIIVMPQRCGAAVPRRAPMRLQFHAVLMLQLGNWETRLLDQKIL